MMFLVTYKRGNLVWRQVMEVSELIALSDNGNYIILNAEEMV